MSNNEAAVYVYHGPLPTLLDGVRQAVTAMKLITSEEVATPNSFSLAAAEKKGFITTKWPGKFVVKAATGNGVSTLVVTAEMKLTLASTAQELGNEAKLNEFMELIKAFAPDTK
jgi:hypothetical protein